MLSGERVRLRAVEVAELPQVHAWRYDPDTFLAVDPGPYVVPAVADFAGARDDAAVARFGVESRGRLVGYAELTGIDGHNRTAQAMVTIDPGHRGQGLGRDALAVLTDYAVRLRGLNRVEARVLVRDEAGLRTALSAGYREECRRAQARFAGGGFADEAVLVVLAADWLGVA